MLFAWVLLIVLIHTFLLFCFILCLVEWFVLDGVVRCYCVCCGGLMWCMFADVATYGLFVLALVCAVWWGDLFGFVQWFCLVFYGYVMVLFWLVVIGYVG